MGLIALKVDVDTLRGTLEGVPRLLRVFERRGIAVTFLFSLGPDHTGWALRRAFRRGFLSKVSRTSVLRHYGARTLLYGLLLPAPLIARRGAAPLRACRDAGHECGIHAWDHVLWHDNVRRRDAHWTRAQMALARQCFEQVFGAAPSTHGAAGWQMNDDALAQIDDWGMAYASDCRGSRPFRPRLGARTLRHLQLPTTLPTLDELIGLDGVDETNVADAVLARTRHDTDQVFTLHAELEGGLLATTFESILDGWLRQGHRLGSLAMLHASLPATAAPVRDLGWGALPGRSGEVLTER
ncbi:MAG TPA: polysaccharide deacetylase family protein [Burkholderiaceae bacterium]|nr:polysaccharide deacetylase family protein [Burkholderiaceae bacterium]